MKRFFKGAVLYFIVIAEIIKQRFHICKIEQLHFGVSDGRISRIKIFYNGVP